MLKAEGVTQCDVIGHSMGGYVAMALLDLYPGLLMKLVLINSHVFPDDDEKTGTRLKSIRFIERHGTSYYLNSLFMNLFHSSFNERNEDLIALLVEKAKQISPDVIISSLQVMARRPDRSWALKTLEKPVLILGGRNDQTYPLTHNFAQASLPDETEIHMFNNVGHMVMYELPGESIRIICKFLACR